MKRFGWWLATLLVACSGSRNLDGKGIHLTSGDMHVYSLDDVTRPEKHRVKVEFMRNYLTTGETLVVYELIIDDADMTYKLSAQDGLGQPLGYDSNVSIDHLHCNFKNSTGCKDFSFTFISDDSRYEYHIQSLGAVHITTQNLSQEVTDESDCDLFYVGLGQEPQSTICDYLLKSSAGTLHWKQMGYAHLLTVFEGTNPNMSIPLQGTVHSQDVGLANITSEVNHVGATDLEGIWKSFSGDETDQFKWHIEMTGTTP